MLGSYGSATTGFGLAPAQERPSSIVNVSPAT
jgi:hypothetical protein